MAKFVDRLGREWRVDVLVAHLPILRKDFGVDLKSKEWPRQVSDLVEGDDEGFVSLLGTLCDEQVKASNLTPEQFIAGFDVRTLIAAGDAVEDAFTDFSPVLRRSNTTRQKVKDKTASLRERIDRRMADAVDVEAEARIEEAMVSLDATLKNSAGGSPASSESTPTA